MELLENTKIDIESTMKTLKHYLKKDINENQLSCIRNMLVGIANSSAMDTKNSINLIMTAIDNLKK